MKRLTALFLAAALVLAGCGGTQAPAETTVSVTTVPETQATVPVETTVVTEPPAPEADYTLTVQRNLPLSEEALSRMNSLRDPGLPEVESILVDDIPILLTIGASDEPMPICIFLHGGGSKEGYINSARCYAKDFQCICITIDGGACGESPRGAMTDAETICGLVEDLDKVIAFVSTLPGADLNRIYMTGGSMGGCTILTYLARGSFKPVYVRADVPRADYTTVPSGTELFSIHGSNPRETAHLTEEEVRTLVADYSPIAFAENMMDTYVSVNVGLLDAEDAVASCKALEARFQELGKENYEFNYHQAGHMLSGWIWNVAEEKFLKELQSGSFVENEVPTVTIQTVTQ